MTIFRQSIKVPSSGSGRILSTEIGQRQTSPDFYISKENLAAGKVLSQNILVITSQNGSQLQIQLL